MLNIWSNSHTIILESQDGDNLDIHITSKEKGKFNNIFALPLMDIDVDSLHIPETEYEVDIIMNSSQFKSTIESLGNFSDTLDICCNEENLILKSDSTEGSILLWNETFLLIWKHRVLWKQTFHPFLILKLYESLKPLYILKTKKIKPI